MNAKCVVVLSMLYMRWNARRLLAGEGLQDVHLTSPMERPSCSDNNCNTNSNNDNFKNAYIRNYIIRIIHILSISTLINKKHNNNNKHRASSMSDRVAKRVSVVVFRIGLPKYGNYEN